MRTAVSVRRLRWLSLALGLALAARQWVCMPELLTGESMRPTLHGGELVWVNKLAYRFGRPRRGEVVQVWTGRDVMVKRVLGLPGENIAMHDGIFYVNGAPLTEPYVQFKDESNIAPGLLGPDRFLVAGDNRSKTIIAVVNRDRIVGRVLRKQYGAQVAVILQDPVLAGLAGLASVGQ
jgi:signal peptidase I